LKFNIYLPASAKITDAKLSLFIVRNDYLDIPETIDVYEVIENWNEKMVNWLNQPRWSDHPAASHNIHNNLNDYATLDLTDLVKKWASDPGQNFGICIKARNEGDVSSLLAFNSRESIYDSYNRLIISYEETEQTTQAARKGKPRVAILTPQFLEWSGDRCLFGGGERYCYDLACLLNQEGFRVEVFQPSNQLWERTYNGMPIHGIGASGFQQDFHVTLNCEFYKRTADFDHHIYLNMDVMYPLAHQRAIGISHGVWWDSTERKYWRTSLWFKRLEQAISNMRKIVSVDTNTINWVKAVFPDLGDKLVYIPNYVDLDQFPDVEAKPRGDRIQILYPRRLHSGRGWTVSKEVARRITGRYPYVDFVFVGRGSPEAEAHMQILADTNPQIRYRWYPMEQMHQVYRPADIVIIPSLYSEGTSLSLLEAMASRKPVIAGLVGGLTDIVIPEFNGKLIPISPDSLEQAIVELIEDPEHAAYLAYNAYVTAKHFSKEIWKKRWRAILADL